MFGFKKQSIGGLNPYCSGRKNRILLAIVGYENYTECLNPYCSGRKNRIPLANCLMQ